MDTDHGYHTSTGPWSITNYPALIVEEAIDLLRLEGDYTTLKSLCLTAAVFQDMTQKAIFRKAQFINPPLENARSFCRTVEQQTSRIEAMYKSVMARGELAQYVKEVELDTSDQSITTPAILNFTAYLLSKFKRVESITLSSGRELMKLQDTVLENSIFTVLESPSMLHVTFSSFQLLVPAHILHLGPSVKTLAIINGSRMQPFAMLDIVARVKPTKPFDKFDFLEGYPGRLSKSAAKKRLYIDELDIDITFSAFLGFFDYIISSEYCHLDLSRLTKLRLSTDMASESISDGPATDPGQSPEEPQPLPTFLHTATKFCSHVFASLTHLTLFDDKRGFLFPEHITVKDFPKLECLKVCLGVHQKDKELDPASIRGFLNFLGNGHLMSKLEVVLIAIGVLPGTLPSEARNETAFWEDLALILCSPGFVKFQQVWLAISVLSHSNAPGDVVPSDVWRDSYMEVLEILHEKGVLASVVVEGIPISE